MKKYQKIIKAISLSGLILAGTFFWSHTARAAGEPDLYLSVDKTEISIGETAYFSADVSLPDDYANPDPNYECYIYLENGDQNGLDITDGWTVPVNVDNNDEMYCTASWTPDYATTPDQYTFTAELYQNGQKVSSGQNWVTLYNDAVDPDYPPIDPPVDPPIDPPADPEITTTADTWLSPDQTIDPTTTNSTNILLSFALIASNPGVSDCGISVSDSPDNSSFSALNTSSNIDSPTGNYLFGTCSATWNFTSGITPGAYDIRGYFVDQDGTTWEAWPVVYTLLPKDTAPNITEPRLEITYNNGEKYNACMNIPGTLTVNVHVALPEKPTSVNEYQVKLFISHTGYQVTETSNPTLDSHIGTGSCGTDWVCETQPLDNPGSYTFDPEFTHDFTNTSQLYYHEVTAKLLRHIAGAGYDTNKASDYQTVKVTVFNNIGTVWTGADSSVGWVYLTKSGCKNPEEYTPPGAEKPTGKPTGGGTGTGTGNKIVLDSSQLVGGTIHKISDLFGSLFGDSTRTGILMILIGVGALVGLLYTGFIFLTADGDEKKIEQAKKSAVAIVIGLVAGTLSYIIIFTVVGIIKRFQ